MITININGLTLCHKGSGGISHNTLPDVCKTPPFGVPVPYENEAYSADLIKGTTSVFADGGNMIANVGSQFARSVFDEAGSMGGILSGTNMAETEWISHSFDVFFEKKPACRLTDKLFMNHRNTVNMAGEIQAPIEAMPEVKYLCQIICTCDASPTTSASGKTDLKEFCVETTLLNEKNPFNTIKPEIPYDMTKTPPRPLLNREALKDGIIRPSEYLPKRMKIEKLKPAKANGGIYQVRVPDAVIMRNPAIPDLTAPNLKAVVEIKFDQAWDPIQIRDYGLIAGPDKVVLLSPTICLCAKEESEQEYETDEATETDEEREGFYETMQKLTGLTGAALVIYIIISEGSRLFPPRNLFPVP
ncbi:DUF4150 domain-containing protein [Salmonella bongori]|uniref:DUF4150 domain-containing protein n=1 Tax=Salmonella bongori TaxID=54736 RepID=UPI00215DAB8F|nr:DUF4150 domain-containing protein [Salmonella bongori]